MMVLSKRAMPDLMESGSFDADWYSATYPDVAASGLDPATHYLQYGHRLNRDPGPEFSTRFARVAYNMSTDREPIGRLAGRQRRSDVEIKPDPKRVLLAANSVAKAGDHARAIQLARVHLSRDLAHTVEILQANAAVARGDSAAWARHLNAYLAHYKIGPIDLGPPTPGQPDNVFGRLAGTALKPVTEGPLVTVIMAAWNAEQTVHKAAQSILEQTWRNLEFLIVDDCSTDGTWAVLQRLAASDARVKIARNAVNVGPYVSKNIALGQSTGAWITGQDADDWSHPQRLEHHLKHLLGSKEQIVASRSFLLRIKENGLFSGISRVSPEKIDGVLLGSAISGMFDRAFFNAKIGSYDCARFGADNELFNRIEMITGQPIDAFRSFSMLCQELEGSLTNNAIFGASLQYPQTPGRLEYRAAWQGAHAQHDAGTLPVYGFPPEKDIFDKPDIAKVAMSDIRTAAGSTVFTPSSEP